MTRAVLLDLGNVVLGVDFRRVFDRWAELGATDAQHFHERWAIDAAYRAHEVGAIDFAEYCRSLRRRFEIELTDAEWRDGWNDIYTAPFETVVDLLPAVAERYELYALTNTNDTHAVSWRRRYPGALEHFEHIFVSSEIGLRKPDAAAFEHVCAAIDHAPGEVLFLDDTLENVHGGQAAGLSSEHVASERAVHDTLRALL